MKRSCQLRFAGSGGQGVILLSVIVAEAAILSGLNAAQTQSYGPEARGGICKAETIISTDPIKYTKVRVPDVLLVLNQESFEKYGADLGCDSIIISDKGLSIPDGIDRKKVIEFGLTGAAIEETGRMISANIAAAGALQGYLKLFGDSALEEAVRRHVPPGSEEANLRVLHAGMALGAQLS